MHEIVFLKFHQVKQQLVSTMTKMMLMKHQSLVVDDDRMNLLFLFVSSFESYCYYYDDCYYYCDCDEDDDVRKVMMMTRIW